ncbi:hypothetical protein D3C72_2417940 [compost metagenome]
MSEPFSAKICSERSRGAQSPLVSRATTPERKLRQPTEKSGAMTICSVPGPLSGKVTAEKAVKLSTGPNSETSQERA